jgi:hypothetical protein
VIVPKTCPTWHIGSLSRMPARTWPRIDMEYVCPGEVDKVDDALSQIQDIDSKFDLACDTPAEMRTEEQQ